MSGAKTNSGRSLNDEWRVGAVHALYHKDGNWFNELERFPGALFDPNGYLLFESREQYMSCPYLDHGEKLHVPGGISRVPGYVRKSQLKPAIPHARPVATTLRRPNEVGPNSRVELDDGRVIVIGVDATPGSPIGSALMGHIAGESVTATTPRGQIELRIARVS